MTDSDLVKKLYHFVKNGLKPNKIEIKKLAGFVYIQIHPMNGLIVTPEGHEFIRKNSL